MNGELHGRGERARDASPSPHSSLKKIFEKWRVCDTSKLTGKRLVEFEQDRKESNRRYDEAFNIVLSHTPDIELREFWQLFPEVEGGHRSSSLSMITNPMVEELESPATREI